MVIGLFIVGVVCVYPEAFAKLGLGLTIVFVLIMLMPIIQGLSVLSYFRWRIKQRLSRR